MTAENGTRHMTSFYNETLLSHSSQIIGSPWQPQGPSRLLFLLQSVTLPLAGFLCWTLTSKMHPQLLMFLQCRLRLHFILTFSSTVWSAYSRHTVAQLSASSDHCVLLLFRVCPPHQICHHSLLVFPRCTFHHAMYVSPRDVRFTMMYVSPRNVRFTT